MKKRANAMGNQSDVCVVIPAFNEGLLIGQVLDELMRTSYKPIVVDDGSTDNTADQALRYPVTVLRHACNLGQGAALQTGIDYALRLPLLHFIVTLDADGQHSAEDIPKLVESLRTGCYDVALGSRFCPGSHVIDIGFPKRVVLFVGVLITRLTTGLKVTDTHNGVRAFTVEAAREINISQGRMAHATEILNRIAARKMRYCEIPVTVKYTDYSRSKGQSVLEGINILWDILTSAR